MADAFLFSRPGLVADEEQTSARDLTSVHKKENNMQESTSQSVIEIHSDRYLHIVYR